MSLSMLDFIAPPFIPERDEYWKEKRGGSGSPHTAMFKWVESLQLWSQRFGSGASTLSNLLDTIGFAKGDFAGNTSMLETSIHGDWI